MRELRGLQSKTYDFFRNRFDSKLRVLLKGKNKIVTGETLGAIKYRRPRGTGAWTVLIDQSSETAVLGGLFGRRPSSSGGEDNTFYQDVLEWVSARGLEPEVEVKGGIQGLAFVIMRQLQQSGSVKQYTYDESEFSDDIGRITSEIVSEAIPFMTSRYSEILLDKVRDNISKNSKTEGFKFKRR